MADTDRSDSIMDLMRDTVAQIRSMASGMSNERIGRCMVLAGLELWCEAVGPERLAIQLNAMAKGVERDALLEAGTPPVPPLAH